MSTPLRVLLVEQDPARERVIEAALRHGGYLPDVVRVETRASFRDAVANRRFDVVIARYQLPRMDGLSALAVVREQQQRIPVILIGGDIGEETAVAAIKAGAAELVHEDNLGRLVPAVSREVRMAAEQHRQTAKDDVLVEQKEQQLRLALVAAKMGTWDWDFESDRIVWSEYAERVLGRPWPMLPASRGALLTAVASDDRPVVQRALDEALTGGTDLQVAFRVRFSDEDVRWLAIKGCVYERRGAMATRMAGTVADITDRKQREVTDPAVGDRYRDLYEEAPVALCSLDANGVVREANREARLDLAGRGKLVGRSLMSLCVDAAERERLSAFFGGTAGDGVISNRELEMLGADGSTWWASVSIRPEMSVGADATGFRVFLVDVTHRRRLDEVRQLSEHAIEGSPDLIAVCDSEYLFRRVNRAHTKHLGADADSIIGRTLEEVYGSATFRDMLREPFDRCLRGEEVHIEGWIAPPGGTRFYGAGSFMPLRSRDGEVDGVILILRDTTAQQRAADEREDLEARLRQAQRMEALGTLAGGIAHDFNNLLLAILGYGELTRDDLPDGSPLRSNLDNIMAAGERAQTLVKQILAFARRSERELALIEIQTVVRETVSFLRASLPSTIDITQEMEPEPCVVLADAAQLNQVVLNLASNAAHAMRDRGGDLKLEVQGMTLDAAEAGRIGGLHPGEYVRLTVRDTGHGMSSEVLHRIYDPFFTTKGPGEGTGLGLSVVHGIVISHGGALHVDSVPGVGTRFDMYFPRTEAIRRHSPAGGIPVETGSEHVLFVDDEEHIAELGRRILERLGYQVTAETSSVRARERFETHPDSFDVIVTDQTMPRLTGLELAHEARRIRPEVPVVLTTGFSESVTTERLIQEGIAALVMKPYGGADLARAVRDALHRARTTSPR